MEIQKDTVRPQTVRTTLGDYAWNRWVEEAILKVEEDMPFALSSIEAEEAISEAEEAILKVEESLSQIVKIGTITIAELNAGEGFYNA